MPLEVGGDELRRRVASLLVVRASGHLADGQRRYPRWELENATLQALLAEGVGGVILLGGSAPELRLRTRQLRSWSPQPLLLCADVEDGVGQRFEGASWLPPPLGVGQIHRHDPEAALATALGRIQAATAVVAGRHDLYFPPADCAHEAALIPEATVHVLESDLGHRAGNPRQAPAEQAQLRAVVEELLRR
jgi:beta-glucosidase